MTGVTRRVSVSNAGAEADGDSFLLGISADGRQVLFGSIAGNLVRGDSNNDLDVFVGVRTQ